MAFQVFHSVLPLAVGGLVQVLHDLGSCQLRSFAVRIDIVHKHGKALRLVPGLRGAGAPWPCAIEHDPGIAEMHLRAVDPPAWFTKTVMLDETKCFRQPSERICHIPIREMRQYYIRRHGTVFRQEPSFTYSLPAQRNHGIHLHGSAASQHHPQHVRRLRPIASPFGDSRRGLNGRCSDRPRRRCASDPSHREGRAGCPGSPTRA